MGDTSCTPLSIAVLGYLAERAMHPYEICQLAVHRREDRLVKISPGSVYRTVYKLEESGFARSLGTEREGARPERTRFEITDAGRKRLAEGIAEMLATRSPEYPQFPVALSEAHTLPLERVVSMLEQRRASTSEALDELDAARRTVIERDVPRMYVLHLSHERALLDAELTWLDTIIEQLRGGEVPWLDERDSETREAAYERARSTLIN